MTSLPTRTEMYSLYSFDAASSSRTYGVWHYITFVSLHIYIILYYRRPDGFVACSTTKSSVSYGDSTKWRTLRTEMYSLYSSSNGMDVVLTYGILLFCFFSYIHML